MKYKDIKVGGKVVDTWWRCWGTGTVIQKLKTVIYIDFKHEGVLKFDKPHLIFLEEKK